MNVHRAQFRKRSDGHEEVEPIPWDELGSQEIPAEQLAPVQEVQQWQEPGISGVQPREMSTRCTTTADTAASLPRRDVCTREWEPRRGIPFRGQAARCDDGARTVRGGLAGKAAAEDESVPRLAAVPDRVTRPQARKLLDNRITEVVECVVQRELIRDEVPTVAEVRLSPGEPVT